VSCGAQNVKCVVPIGRQIQIRIQICFRSALCPQAFEFKNSVRQCSWHSQSNADTSADPACSMQTLGGCVASCRHRCSEVCFSFGLRSWIVSWQASFLYLLLSAIPCGVFQQLNQFCVSFRFLFCVGRHMQSRTDILL
jgi:hypothetical protein